MSLDVTLGIDTPEQVVLELRVAGLGSRFAAVAIDTVLQVVGYLLLLVAAFLGVFRNSPAWVRTALPVFMILGFAIVYWGYFSAFELLWDGRTPGKRIAGIRVIKNTGRPIRAYEAIARNIIRVVDFLPAMYAIGVIVMLIDSRGRRLGDFVAGTIVVHDRRDPVTSAGGLMLSDGPDAARLAPDRAARVTSEELTLIESYLQRRFDLDPDVRDDIARQIVGRLTKTTGVEPTGSITNDEFLEMIAASAREYAGKR
jgi:uncharacterized RDD family membrane protein YckC